ncbi:hypothetical protein J6590_007804 [Homalodisca vitripennis]|nr:hypothetical protein J6590_007804 [Homalodisca vitripennis]
MDIQTIENEERRKLLSGGIQANYGDVIIHSPSPTRGSTIIEPVLLMFLLAKTLSALLRRRNHLQSRVQEYLNYPETLHTHVPAGRDTRAVSRSSSIILKSSIHMSLLAETLALLRRRNHLQSRVQEYLNYPETLHTHVPAGRDTRAVSRSSSTILKPSILMSLLAETLGQSTNRFPINIVIEQLLLRFSTIKKTSSSTILKPSILMSLLAETLGQSTNRFPINIVIEQLLLRFSTIKKTSSSTILKPSILMSLLAETLGQSTNRFPINIVIEQLLLRFSTIKKTSSSTILKPPHTHVPAGRDTLGQSTNRFPINIVIEQLLLRFSTIKKTAVSRSSSTILKPSILMSLLAETLGQSTNRFPINIVIEQLLLRFSTIKKTSSSTILKPSILMSLLAETLDTVITNLLEYRTCRVLLELPHDNCTDPVSPNVEDLVQPTTAHIITGRALLEAFVPSCMAVLIGPWSDANGRKPFMVISLAGISLTYFCWGCLSLLPNLHPYVFLLASLPMSLSGGSCAVYLLTYCYISDVTDEHTRSFR